MKSTGSKIGIFLFLLGIGAGMAFMYNNYSHSHPDQCSDYNNNSNKAQATMVELVQDPIDTVRNPYAPPVRQHSECEYAQLGYLSTNSGNKRPLFGKRAHHRDKWFYYTEVDGIKLPVEFKNHKCTASPGCDMLACRDTVKVDGAAYTVNLYESDLFTYNPFL